MQCRSDAETFENMRNLGCRRKEAFETVTRFTRFAGLCRRRGPMLSRSDDRNAGLASLGLEAPSAGCAREGIWDRLRCTSLRQTFEAGKLPETIRIAPAPISSLWVTTT